ncbi:c-type cytochrome [Luteimonas composti]|uniref:C-type cytochrome n=1 Tax=Luteimonas composti TaxID=398257 RepID=A0ABT6MQS2_9GAMM|nr:c-type cytochrome [Luteimonas composti]MDH7452651.1 c-type cytochrome [Luteimonas composti]
MTRPSTIAASLAAVLVLASLPHSTPAQDATPPAGQASPADADAATGEASAAPAQPAPAATPAALAGNADSGRQLTYTCLGCHGIVGYRNVYPTYHVPKIGGQSAAYLGNALTEYRKGTRKHPTMQAQAQSFSDQDIADIAAFLSELKP